MSYDIPPISRSPHYDKSKELQLGLCRVQMDYCHLQLQLQ